MVILIVIVVIYILMSLTLTKLFQKAGVETWKALVPGVNFVEMCKLVGQPTHHAAWMLFPIVNIFTYAGLKVDLVRSFGKFSFMDSFWAVVFSPFIFWKIGNDNSQYEGAVIPKEKDYHQQVQDAIKRKDERGLKKLNDSPYHKGALREWAEAIVFAVFAASFIRMFLIEAYVIPTSSMEGSLLVGDYLFVSKAHYGIRTPKTILQIPLLHNQVPVLGTESYIAEPSLPSFRLPALQKVERNAPFVFNWPIGDSVYITPERSWNVEQIRKMSPTDIVRFRIPENWMDKLVVRPIDKKDHYIKRCVALPGDVFELRERQIYINGQPAPNPQHMQFAYRLSGNLSINPDKFREWNIHLDDLGQGMSTAGYFTLDNQQLENFKSLGAKAEFVYKGTTPSPDIFPQDTTHFKWNIDNMGPFKIPAAGATVELKPENIALYRRIIAVYEGNKLEERNGQFFINGQAATSYTFKQDYYWAMGDNRHNSEDSRYWGFVPGDHIVGKPLFIWMSSGEYGIRWNRIFSSANKN